MANCTCPKVQSSLSELCESCRVEYLKLNQQAELEDALARVYGCAPESITLITEAEAHAIAQANAQDSYEPCERTPDRRLDTHARKIADLETRLNAQAETIRLLQTSVRALIEMSIRRPAA